MCGGSSMVLSKVYLFCLNSNYKSTKTQCARVLALQNPYVIFNLTILLFVYYNIKNNLRWQEIKIRGERSGKGLEVEKGAGGAMGLEVEKLTKSGKGL